MTRTATFRFVLPMALTVMVIALSAGGASGESTAPIEAKQEARWGLGKGSHLRLDGDSTLHRYKAESTQLSASVSLSPGAEASDASSLLAAARAGQLAAVDIRLPVQSLSSGEGGLDKNMWKTLKAEKAPQIVFHLVSCRAESSSPNTLQVSGRLAVAGVEKNVDLPVSASPAGEQLFLKGTLPMRMSDFGVQPPVLFAGAVKTSDQVSVTFELKLQRM